MLEVSLAARTRIIEIVENVVAEVSLVGRIRNVEKVLFVANPELMFADLVAILVNVHLPHSLQEHEWEYDSFARCNT